jgi:hypothetical protein
MSFIEFISSNSPITNIPDLFNLHHSNPLSIPVAVQLALILLLSAAMFIVNIRISYHGKQKLYPALYTLLGLTLVACCYYCFIDSSFLSESNHIEGTGFHSVEFEPKAFIGWFCMPGLVGWGKALISLALLTFVIYSILSAVMQTVAELSVHAGMSLETKPWKEWKVAVFLMLVGALLVTVTLFSNLVLSSWMLVATMLVLFVFVVCKIIVDSLRCKSFGWGLLIGLVYMVSIYLCLILTLECLRGCVFFIVLLAAFLTQAKARKKQVQQ